MIHFEWIWMLLICPLPLLVYWLVTPASRETGALNLPFLTNLNEFENTEKSATSRFWQKLITMTLIWLLLVVSAARPQVIGDAVNVPVSGRDLMLAIDVSGSMEAQDILHNDQPQTRLAAVKRMAGEFIDQRLGDRIGLILFGTQAYLQAPLSLDRKTIVTLLNESAIGIAGEKTSIGDAIGLAIKRLESREQSEKVLILLTDGSNTAGAVAPDQAARLAQTSGLRVHTVGIGATKMEVVDFFGKHVINPSRDLDEPLLRQIAAQTGGQYFRATDEASLRSIYDVIDKLEPVEHETDHLRPVRELFFWPLGCAVAIWLIWLLGVVIKPWMPTLLTQSWMPTLLKKPPQADSMNSKS